jgi:hypothetical protein
MKTNKSRVALGFAAAALMCGILRAADIEPPKVELIDEFGVNIANGQVSHSMEIVSIGGAMGLSDSVTVRANELDVSGSRGFNHKFFGQARDVAISTTPTLTLSPRNIMRVYDPSGSADFAYYEGNTLRNDGDISSNYSYRPLGDERHSLVEAGDLFEWTKPDGTITRFARRPLSSGAPTRKAFEGGQLVSITYPNGFTITVTSSGMSVNTNTGFQLKQFYAADPNFCGSVWPIPRTSVESGWSTRNPKFVVAINAAIEHCSATATASGQHDCALNRNWPKAEFIYPSCMPDIMRRTPSQIGVPSQHFARCASAVIT